MGSLALKRFGGTVVRILAATMLMTGTAAADLSICNRSSAGVFVALAYEEQGHWLAKGWWQIAARECEILVTGDLENRHYYAYAEDEHREIVWDGEHNFCTDDQEFVIAAGTKCGRQAIKGFFEIDTGGDADVSWDLTAANQPLRKSTKQTPWPRNELRLRWTDHAIAYDGVFKLLEDEMLVNADLFDLETQKLITRHQAKLGVLIQGKDSYSLLADFPVQGDSQTPNPHTHRMKLIFLPDGTMQNCPDDKACYDVEEVTD